MAIALLILGGGLLAFWLRALGGVEALRTELGPATAVAIVPIQALIAVSPFPSEVVAIATSVLYGFWGGALPRSPTTSLATRSETTTGARRLSATARPAHGS